MIAPRWRKVLRDLLGQPGRTTLAVLALATGVFQVAALVHKYAILQPLLATMYARTNPASAVLFTDQATDEVVDRVRGVPGVAAAEARPVILARVRVPARAAAATGAEASGGSAAPDAWMPIVLNVIGDFDDLRVDTFARHAGAWPPAAGEILIERSASGMTGFAIGDTLTIRGAGGEEATVRLAGTAHADGVAPAWMDHIVPAFIGRDSALRAALGGESAQIRLVAADHPYEEGHVRDVAARVKAALAAGGHEVVRTGIDNLGRHPHADQMATFLYLLGAFGALSLVLSAALVAGMAHALVSEQVRQVGIMKAIGATTRQVAGIYLGQIGILAVVALGVGVPPGLMVGRAYAGFAASVLNVDITDTPFPARALVAVLMVGLLLPLVVAIGPVLRASRVPVRQALDDTLGPRPFGARPIERALTRFTWIPRPLALSLRTTSRRTGRLALTVGTLALGGAVFMSAINVSRAWTRAVETDFASRRFDLSVLLSKPAPKATLDPIFAADPGVARVEYWRGATPYLVGADGSTGPAITLLGIAPDSAILAPQIVAGRWLGASETGAVVNQTAVAKNPALGVGATITMRLGEREFAFPIVGIVRELVPAPVVYAPIGLVDAAIGQDPAMVRSVRVVTAEHDDAAQRAAAERLETALNAAGVEVGGITRTLDQKKAILDHLVIVMLVLTMAAGIVVLVGAIGLTSALTLGVVQRTREIGILGAIGATSRVIASHIWYESLIIAGLSWFLAVLLAAPASLLLESVTGRIFFKAPLDFAVSIGAAFL
ncbi:MAG TPA: FtsX-like permease family protein, partial [Dongiaceae bacterium]|nr:FtsX-like permease family protein [Dongiaceae bacterium]